MSAAEKLRALEEMRPTTDRANALYRLVAPSKWERGRDIEVIMDALPQIMAVVKAAEEAARYDYCDEDDGEGLCSSSDGEFAEWQDIGDALAALDEALVSAES